MTIARKELAAHLDEVLEIDNWAGIDKSLNGLQVEGDERVENVTLAVDGCRETFERCASMGRKFLIVHHGLFWGQPLAITGSHCERVKTLLAAGISLYAAHFPLDFHPQLGHNARIARLLELEDRGALVLDSGLPVGTLAENPRPERLESFVRRLDEILDTDCHVLTFGPEEVRRVGIIAGDGNKLLDEPLSERIDTFVTGEQNHTVYHFAREFGVNVVFAGHYATEVPGLLALGDHLRQKFELDCKLIPAPTGL
ncbi:MAG: Nif3-like dinuclear metal center hexameric protein [Candidatus Glassbacteria bacterium]|nr:Nif3-like dinuclear metal center hexameric protein [Candidatus Glassbacteria bacterium]